MRKGNGRRADVGNASEAYIAHRRGIQLLRQQSAQSQPKSQLFKAVNTALGHASRSDVQSDQTADESALLLSSVRFRMGNGGHNK